MIEQIKSREKEIALIIRREYTESGIHFFTSNDASLQLGYMNYPHEKIIEPHIHNPVLREIQYTQEVLFIRKGKLRVDFYDDERQFLESRVLNAGDVILLSTGGHGFEVLEDIEMFEVKQGPYAGNLDKTRFNSHKSRTFVGGNHS
jgi:hypothetical protein